MGTIWYSDRQWRGAWSRSEGRKLGFDYAQPDNYTLSENYAQPDNYTLSENYTQPDNFDNPESVTLSVVEGQPSNLFPRDRFGQPVTLSVVEGHHHLTIGFLPNFILRVHIKRASSPHFSVDSHTIPAPFHTFSVLHTTYSEWASMYRNGIMEV
jgi:hypothetical protein